jgi:hypothetical protein
MVILTKVDGIRVIIDQTKNTEYFLVIESSIKLLEKISKENSHYLIEKDAFQAVLNYIDFFEINIRVNLFLLKK